MSVDTNSPDAMKERLLLIVNRLKSDRTVDSLNEEATRQTIILPILAALGWNTHNAKEVAPENKLDSGRMDYLLKHENTEIVIEVKRPSKSRLENYEAQLLGYSFQRGSELAILTNGVEWWFYHPLSKGDWKDRRFNSLNISSVM